jgi:hypothetical protein
MDLIAEKKEGASYWKFKLPSFHPRKPVEDNLLIGKNAKVFTYFCA